MKEKIFSVLRVALFFAIGLVLFWLVVRNQDIGDIKTKLQHANWWWAVLSLVFGFASNVFRALRWNMLIHPLGYRPKVVNTFGAVMVGYMANLALPRLGEISRCAVVNRYEKTPINKLLGTVVVERVIDVLCIFLLLLVVVALEYELMSSFSMEYVFNPLALKITALFAHGALYYVIAGGALVVLVVVSWLVIRRVRKTQFYTKLKIILRGFITGIKTVGQLQNRNLFLLYTILIWSMYLLMSYSCFFCFGATTGLGFVVALAVMVFGGFGWAAPVQGGLGTFHIIVTHTLMLFGILENDALAYAMLSWATQVFAMLSLGLLSLTLLPILNKKKTPDPTSPV